MSTIQDRLREVFPPPLKRGLAARISELCGVSRTSVSAWFNMPERVTSISRTSAEKICAAFAPHISPAWLAEGIGNKDVAKSGFFINTAYHPRLSTRDDKQAPAGFEQNLVHARQGTRPYPVISYIQAGSMREISDPYPVGEGFDVEYGDDDASLFAFFLQVEGDSMLPEFHVGDRVLIDPEVMPRPGDYVAARNGKAEATLKKYRVRGIDSNGNEIFELVPLNENYPILNSVEHHLKVIGTVIEHRRKFRKRYGG